MRKLSLKVKEHTDSYNVGDERDFSIESTYACYRMLHLYFWSISCCEFCCWDQTFIKSQEIWQHTSSLEWIDPISIHIFVLKLYIIFLLIKILIWWQRIEIKPFFNKLCIFVPVLMIKSTSFRLLNRFSSFVQPWALLTAGLQNKIF